MKKLLLVPFLILTVFSLTFADELIYDNPEQEVSPIAVKSPFENVNISLERKILTVWYTKVNAAGQDIPKLNGRTTRKWICQNITDDPDTPEDETNLCWDSVFLFSIRTQDVGTLLGRGLRNLIKVRMVQAGVISDGTFND